PRGCIEGVVGICCCDGEIIRAEKVTAERTARRFKLQSVIKETVAAKDLGLAIAEQIVGATQARSNLLAPTKFNTRYCRTGQNVAGIKRRHEFFFESNTQVQGETTRRLPPVLEVNALIEVLANTLRSTSGKTSDTNTACRAESAGKAGGGWQRLSIVLSVKQRYSAGARVTGQYIICNPATKIATLEVVFAGWTTDKVAGIRGELILC